MTSRERCVAWALGAVALAVPAQATAQHGLDLPGAVRAASGSAVGEADAEALAAASDAARLALLPSLSVSAQVVRSAANVGPGATWGNEGVPAISGPPFDLRFDDGVWLSQVAVGLSVAPLDLLRRVRLLDVALDEEAQARSVRALGALDRAVDIASAFLRLAAAEQVTALVAEELASLAAREDDPREQAAITLEQRALALHAAQARQAESEARARLSGLVSVADVQIRFRVPEREPREREAPHPARAAADSAVRAAEARRAAAELELLPRVELLGALWARGTGLPYPNQTDFGAATGLVPERPGWAVGVSVTWRALELPMMEARARQAAARSRGERARRRALEAQLASQVREARAQRDGAAEVAAVALSAVDAADALCTLEEGRIEERGGLGSWLAARRQRLALRLEAARAPIAVEHARLLVARAEGDLEPFLSRYAGP